MAPAVEIFPSTRYFSSSSHGVDPDLQSVQPGVTRMRTHTKTFPRIAAAAALALVLSDCVVNPATGKRQLIFISEGREIEMGREADPQIVASLGLYDDPALQQYVQDMGSRLAARSERPNLPWTFRVVDDPVVNAFALPGGFIYVTRGILAHLNSEAQLASVLGHEIGHVTGRHSVERISRSQLTQVGLGVGSIVSSTFRDFSGVAGAGLGLLMLSYGRGDERQADDLGLRYMRRGGFDPREMSGVFELLARVSQAHGGRSTPEWLSTHPDPANRKERINDAVAALNESFAGTTLGGDEYLRRLDGLVYGDNPREGFFRDNLFMHPDLEFQIRFPEGWRTINQKQAVAGVSPQEDAIIQVTLASARSPRAAADQFFGQEGINGSRPRSTRINGLSAYAGRFSAVSGRTEVQGIAAFIAFDQNVYQIVGYGAASNWGSYRGHVDRSVNSFDRLRDPEALAVEPDRLDIFALPQEMSLSQFARGYSTGLPLEELILINQAEPDTPLSAGSLIKRVR